MKRLSNLRLFFRVKDRTLYWFAFFLFACFTSVTFQNCAVQQSSALQQLNAQGLTSFQTAQTCLPYFSSNSAGYVFGIDSLTVTSPPVTTPATYTTPNDACLIQESASSTAVDTVLICVHGSAQHDAVMEVVYGMKSPVANATVPATSAWIFASPNVNLNGAAQIFTPPSSTQLNALGVAFWELDTDPTSGISVLAVTGASIAGTVNGVRCYMTYPSSGVSNGVNQPAVISQTQQATDLSVLERAVSVYVQTLN